MIAVGNLIGRKGNIASGAVAWEPSQSVGGETPNLWIKEDTRNAVTLPDSVNPGAGDATVYPAVWNNAVYSANGYAYAYVADNQALNPGAGDLTLACWVKYIGGTAASKFFCGKYMIVEQVGLYLIYPNASKYLTVYVKTSGGGKSIASTQDITDGAWRFAILEIDQTTGYLRFFINNIQIGSDTALGGNMGNLDAAYDFVLNAINGVAGSGYTAGYGFAQHMSDVYIFKKKLTPTEKTTLYNKGFVTGAAAHWCLNDMNGTDVSGNGLNLTFVEPSEGDHAHGRVAYASVGSRQSLEKGYSLYTKALNPDIQIPYSDAGTAIVAPSLPVGYALDSEHPTLTTNHNLADSKLVFQGAELDRSDVTKFNAIARLREYDAALVKGFAVSELNYGILADYSIATGKVFPKISVNSIDDRDNNIEVFDYATNKTGADLTKILAYTNDFNNQPKSVAGVCLSFDDITRCATWVAADLTLYPLYQWKMTGNLNAASAVVVNAAESTYNFKRLMNRGHEMANHTVNHPSWITYLLTHTAQEYYDNEVAPLQGWLNTNYGVTPTTFAYATDEGHDAGIDAVLLANGFTVIKAGLNSTPAPANYGTICYDGSSQVVTALDIGMADTDLADIYAMIDYALTNNKILCLMGHTISAVENLPYEISYSNLAAICDYVNQKKMSFYRLQDLQATLFT